MAEAAGAGAIRAIVLDFNGTLAQDGHLTAPLCVDTFASVGVPLTVEDYQRELAAMPDREASRYADLVIERLDLAALDLILGAEPAEPAEPAERGA